MEDWPTHAQWVSDKHAPYRLGFISPSDSTVFPCGEHYKTWEAADFVAMNLNEKFQKAGFSMYFVTRVLNGQWVKVEKSRIPLEAM